MPAKTKSTTPERILLDTLDRLSTMLAGFSAVQLHLSRLRSQNRTDVQVRIVMRMFDKVVTASRGRIFSLSNGDVVILGRNIQEDQLQSAITHVRDLFQNDPLVFNDPRDEEGKFSTWYKLEKDFSEFYEEIEALEKKYAGQKKAGPAGKKLTPVRPDHLDAVLKNMSSLGMADIIRRQSAVTFSAEGATVSFQEYFTSIQDLRQAVAPEIDLLSDRWLFQHLTQVMDRRMLPVLKSAKLFVKPPAISLNLNISTVFTRDFQRFVKQIEDEQKIIVEVQLKDVFQNISDYQDARDQLRSRGHKILLDGLSALSLRFIDLHLFDADMIKLIWSPTLAEENQTPDPRKLIQEFGPDRVVLARCDSETGIKWGLKAGVKSFQGYFIDAMAGAMTKSACKHGNTCTLGQCIARRALIDGGERGKCSNQKMLDQLPDIRPK